MVGMQKHYVTFYSPGSFLPEETSEEIDSWDVDTAVKMAGEIVERYSARPYAFRFTTRGRRDDEFEPKIIDKSGIYYLGGTVRTAEEVLSGTDPDEEILRTNVKINGYKRIITNTNSWRFTGALHDDDVVLDVILPQLGHD